MFVCTDRGDAQELKVRIGLHVGDVVLSGDDCFDHTVNKAARFTAAGREETQQSPLPLRPCCPMIPSAASVKLTPSN